METDKTQEKDQSKVEVNENELPEKRKVSKTWEAAQRLKGSVIILDLTLLER